MELITEIEDFSGKTINTASGISIADRSGHDGDGIALIFTDETFAILYDPKNDCCDCGCDGYVMLMSNPSNKILHEAGIMSKAEYNLRRDEEDAFELDHKKDSDLRELARLKREYEA